jgi:uncharacterized protein (TIGR02246 family)
MTARIDEFLTKFEAFGSEPTEHRPGPAGDAGPEAAPGLRAHHRGLEPPKPFPSLGDWVEQYTALWQSADPQRFADFYREDGVILNPGMDRPVARREIPGYYQLLLAVAPDLRQNRVSWAGDDTLLYIEWQAAGSIAGRPLRLPVVDRWLLDGGLATEGIAFFDSITLSQALYGDA